MADMQTQTYANHRRFFPLFHFVTVPILVANLLVQLTMAYRRPGVWSGWNVLVAFALVALAFAARLMALRVQDRLIRLEERLRLQQILPADLRGRIGELRTGQLIAMRFCDDAEVPDLCRAVLNGEVKDRGEIKRRIKTWRPDTMRA
jgi:hypothetical protein